MEKNIEVIQKAVKWAYDIANDPKHGYDQILRWGNDYDCSSFVISAYENAGVPLRKNGATYTGNMREVMLKCGFEDVTRIVNFARGTGLLYGDVLLNVKHHTAIYAGNGFEIEASINEKRRVTGGLTGDQTGKEILIRNYRDYPWNYCLRFAGVGSKKRITKKVISDVIAGRYGNGAIRERNLTAEGFDYMEVQKRVNEALRGN